MARFGGNLEMFPFYLTDSSLLRRAESLGTANDFKGGIDDEYERLSAQQLELTVRQVKRLVKKYKEDRAKGLVSKERGKRSNHKYGDEKIEAIKTILETHYHDFGLKFTAEKLYEHHNIQISKETLRQWMMDWGLWKAKRQKQAQVRASRLF